MSENDYDELRNKNIAERKAIFAEFFRDIKKQTNDIKEQEKELVAEPEDSENQPPIKRRRISSRNSDSYQRRSVKFQVRKKYNTRSRTRNSIGDTLNASGDDDDEDITEPAGNRPKLRVLFPWAKPVQRSLDLMKMDVYDVDEEEQQYDNDNEDHLLNYTGKRQVYKVTKSEYDPNSIPSVDEITDEMLENVAERSSLKEYCKINGTSCHQCRQKTLDTKTVCRSGECVGVRGQFCGPCLRGRYGESAKEALKDPDWACPPCRGLCNCSICRTRSGLRPTGILAPTVQEEGFSSVMDYLQVAETET